jgi:2-polyprenyl-6-methoxyphenol hydroxylase-like FAD-dependent oxidoreductase
MSRQYRVGIIGFGVAGGALAALLAKAGHVVTLFERAPKLGPVGAGLLLHPSGQDVLHRLGLLDAIAAQSEPLAGIHAYKRNGGTLVHLRYDELGPGLCGYGVHRGLLFDTLRAEVEKQSIPITLDCTITHWRETSDAVFACDTQRHEHGPFDFLVASDGAHSALRYKVDPRARVHDYAYGAMWAVGPCTSVRGTLYQVVDGTRHLIGILPLGGERATLFWGVRRDQMEILRRAGFAAWREEVCGLCPAAEEIFAEMCDFAQITCTTYCHTSLRHGYTDRILCLGDAAHAMSPHLGQGASLALQDVEVLAQTLGETDDFRAAFRLYTERRRKQIGFYSRLTYLLTPFFQSNLPLLGLGRDIVLPLMPRVPLLRRQMLLTMAGVKPGLLGGLFNSARLLPPSSLKITR